jgi:hypothetical protein
MTVPTTIENPITGPRRWAPLCLLMAALVVPAWSAAGQITAGQTVAAPAMAQQRPRTASPPAWNTLSAPQQAALKPLAPIWNDINSNRKRKWIALSVNFAKLSEAEQATLHGRMGEWAALSPLARNRARLNFVETRALSSQEKMAQWEAYQALSPAQKQQLAAQAVDNRGSGAAPAVTHRAPGKLAAVPVTRSESGSPQSTALPRPAALPAMPASGAASSNP